MQPSIYLARLIGPVLACAGLGMLVNSKVYQTMLVIFLRSYALIYLSGVLTLIAGIAVVHAHNVWSRDWRVIITVFGWLGIVGGILRILVPQVVESTGYVLLASTGFLIGFGVVILAIGAFLIFKGYEDLWPRIKAGVGR
jgi:hypothetical protein